ncbi:MAG: hypothetical protein ACFFER_05235 [Candidatus Thorarchaeota archaeon]
MREDELTWSKIHQDIDNSENLSTADKNRIRKGWSQLEAILGYNWLSKSQRERHPLIHLMSLATPWAKSLIALIGEKLNDLQIVSGFDIKLEELKRPTKKAITIIPELNAAWKLLRNDVDIEFVSETPAKQSADIVAQIDDLEIQIEVTSLETPSHYAIQKEHLSKMVEPLNHPQIYAGCRIYRNLSSTHTDHIVSLIKEMTKLALERNQVIRRWESEIYDICIGPLSMRQDVIDWKLKHNMQPETTLQGPTTNTHQGRKIQSVILTESKQVSENNPGVIFLEGVPFHIFGDRIYKTAPFENEFVEEPLYARTNLLFLVLNNLAITESQEIGLHKVDPLKRNYFAKYRAAPFIDDETWIIVNRFHKWIDLNYKPLLDAFWHVDPDAYLYEHWWADALADFADEMKEANEKD